MRNVLFGWASCPIEWREIEFYIFQCLVKQIRLRQFCDEVFALSNPVGTCLALSIGGSGRSLYCLIGVGWTKLSLVAKDVLLVRSASRRTSSCSRFTTISASASWSSTVAGSSSMLSQSCAVSGSGSALFRKNENVCKILIDSYAELDKTGRIKYIDDLKFWRTLLDNHKRDECYKWIHHFVHWKSLDKNTQKTPQDLSALRGTTRGLLCRPLLCQRLWRPNVTRVRLFSDTNLQPIFYNTNNWKCPFSVWFTPDAR